jgi:hypothetical protein
LKLSFVLGLGKRNRHLRRGWGGRVENDSEAGIDIGSVNCWSFCLGSITETSELFDGGLLGGLFLLAEPFLKFLKTLSDNHFSFGSVLFRLQELTAAVLFMQSYCLFSAHLSPRVHLLLLFSHQREGHFLPVYSIIVLLVPGQNNLQLVFHGSGLVFVLASVIGPLDKIY